MDAWGKSANAENLVMLADGNGAYAKALGLDKDASGYGMGVRSKRFAMVVNNGVVELLNVDESGFESSSAEAVIAALK